MQTSRLFEIVYFLLSKKSVTASELAKHFGVSRRTICRDIDTLSLAGIPIYTERGKGGGISLLPDFVLNKSLLSQQEQNDILAALQILSNIEAVDTSQTLHKLSAIFNKATTNWMEVDFSDWHYENDFFNDIKNAILEQSIIEFDYYNSYGDKTSRRIEPVQLWFKSKSWYLKGFCLTKQDVRLYKLTRIKNLVVTDEYFAKRDLLAKLDNPMKNWDAQQEVTLKLRIDSKMAYRVYDDFGENEIEKQADGSYYATATFPEDDWVYGFLLSYGKHIEVLEPEGIRKTLKEESKNIFEKYL
jgi:predicted DNA-binding transcriptional regulator YafY